MDSGNSGSLQSSSGGDDQEYDSRASVAHHIFMATQPQPPPFFDPFSNYSTQPLRHTTNPSNPNPPWPRSTPHKPDPNPYLFTPSFRAPPSPPAGPDTIAGAPAAAASTAARNPRKRSRASRRAPTTVLTTDTTNFRDMVQEFTGIPAQPFTGSSSSRPNRFQNLFGLRSSAVVAAAQPYPRLPSAHRDLTPPFFLPTSTTNTTSPSSSNINYQQFPFSNNNNNNNLFFNSLLQRNPSKFIVSDSSAMASSKPTFDFQSEAVKSGPGLDVFALDMGLGPHAASGLNNLSGLVSSNRATARKDHEDNNDYENTAKWRRNKSSEDNEGADYDEARMQPVNGRFEFSGPISLGFHLDMGPETIPTTRVGDQGMVESWINSSE